MDNMRLGPLVLLLVPVCLSGQGTATISGTVLDPAGAEIAGALVLVENDVTRYRAQTETAADGTFSVKNIPFHTYRVSVSRAGLQTFQQTVSVRSVVPFQMPVRMELAAASESVTVTAGQTLLVDPEETGTHVQMNQTDIDKLTRQGASRGLESVIVTFPGFAQNANGAIHPRGAHNQMTYVVDGMPISDQLTGSFGNTLDPNIVQTVELFTGNVPAEYGNKVSAVANVTTRSGLGSGRALAGSVALNAARFDQYGMIAQAAGERGRLGYTLTANTLKSNRFLDAVSLDNLHNGGNSQRGFFRLDYQASNKDMLRFNGMAGRSSFQLANLRSQHAAGMQQRQLLQDGSMSLGWVRTLDARTTLDSTTSYRTTDARLAPSAGDTPVTASQSRHLSTFTSGARLNTIRGAHNLRFGGDIQRFPVSEQFSFGITEPDFNHPLSPEFNPNLSAYDLTRGGRLFQFNDKATGGMYSGFFQDAIKWRRWQFSLGLRWDSYRFLVNEGQLQPRLGASFHVKESSTVFRASYSRLFQTPPNENLLLSGSPLAASVAPPVVAETLGSAVVPIRPERQDFLEAGIQQALGRRASLNASYYHKQATDQQDNNNFLNTGIIFPITLARIRVNGVEGRLVLPPVKGFSTSVSVTHARAISTPPFTGGLYIGNSAIDALSMGPFVIDHDQPLAVHAVASYTARSGFYATLSARHDYGLVSNPSDPHEVAADPDFADLLPYVNLTGRTPRVRPRNILDVSAGYERVKDGKRRYDISAQVANLTNRTALFNFQSVFVGTRVVAPITAGVRLRIYF